MELYYTDKNNIFSNKLYIYGQEAHHISRVMRHKPGDMIYVTDGEGNEYQCTIDKINNQIEANIVNINRKAREPKIKVTLAQSIIKGFRMDIIIEKATELGVTEIIPVITERTIAQVSEKKNERFKNIAFAAIKSSTRTFLPEISSPILFSQLVNKIYDYDLTLMAWEEEKHNRLPDIIRDKNLRKVLLIIGPEGGFSDTEVQKALNYGVKCFTLGPRRLRAETAAISALSLLMYELKEM
ncbi:MAG: 16S rRNA (uracil(1498)-N(3))-methyltransferase [candidate division WOR-3 bacterium]|nr:16S rRNA (uracil(1498)-N(3))-methyltransferase [candidate division WOR-3 bacterium]